MKSDSPLQLQTGAAREPQSGRHYSLHPLHPLQVPDYLMVVRRPMDLSTLLTNIDEYKYVTVGEFMSDADLIWQNALEYNPDSDPMGETTINT